MDPTPDLITTIATSLAQDASYVNHLKLARRLKKQTPVLAATFKIAVLSSFTIDALEACLSVQCAQNGIQLQYYQAPYAQYQQEILNPDSALYRFQPQLTLLWADTPALLPALWDQPYQLTAAQRQQTLETAFAAHLHLLDTLRQRLSGLLLVMGCVPPRASEYGILETQQPYSVRYAIQTWNQQLFQHLSAWPASYGVDLAHWAADYGLQRVYDPKLAFYGDIRFSLDFIAYTSHQLLAYILPAQGRVKKCLVVDADNTLWGGIVGEDGWAQLKMGTDTVEGRAFSQFQALLRRYQQRGLLLALNSKNNAADVLEVFAKRPDMLLKPQDFAVMRINWQDKAQNLREIAQTLNIGLESLVFLDDSPQERAIVRQYCPTVLVPELGSPDQYATILLHLVELNTLTITAEDLRKHQQYAEQAARSQLQAQATDLSSYLHSLKTIATITRAQPAQYPRLAQLSQKTNQFNLTTRRYVEADIQRFAESPHAQVYSLAVADQFGDLGLVGLAIWVQSSPDRPTHWTLDSLLLSCRCLGRQVEDAFLYYQWQQLQQQGITSIQIEYIPTPKNSLVADFIERLGWPKTQKPHYYVLDLTAQRWPIPEWINIHTEVHTEVAGAPV